MSTRELKTSVILPARNEKYLASTIDSIRQNAGSEIEIIVVLDGPTEYPLPEFDGKVIEFKESRGIRHSINEAVSQSTGDYILKLDAHCIVSPGFVSALLDNYYDGWVSVASRFTLDLETVKPGPRRVDYFYLSCPWTHPKSMMMQSCPWIGMTDRRPEIDLDELMCFQGSMWFMSRSHWDWLGGLETDLQYAEHHEISMKTWLGGRRVVVNKNAWYAHPSRPTSGYHMSMRQVYKDHAISAKYWTENKWPKRVHDFDWLIDKFWPLPMADSRHRTEKYYWPEDWRKYYAH